MINRGMRVCPPTSTTSLISDVSKPASFSAALQASYEVWLADLRWIECGLDRVVDALKPDETNPVDPTLAHSIERADEGLAALREMMHRHDDRYNKSQRMSSGATPMRFRVLIPVQAAHQNGMMPPAVTE